MLYNFENTLIKLFGNGYALNESLAYSLQFSRLRTQGQIEACKQILSNEVKDLKEFIEKYRDSISDDVFNTQEYSIKLIQVPKIANTSKNDVAIEFVNWNNLSSEDKENFEKVTTIIKDKVIKTEVLNHGKLKPGDVINQVKDSISVNLTHYDHKCLFYILSIRPCKEDRIDFDPFDTNTKYCHYDEAHKDYLYQPVWATLLIRNINSGRLTKEIWKRSYDGRAKLDINLFEN